MATSRTGQDVVLQCYAALREGLGLASAAFPSPVVERIPLGVDVASFTPPTTEYRERLRAELSVPSASVVFLVFARVSPHSKMDLLPVLRAFQRLAQAGIDLRSISLFLAGWTQDGDDYPQTLGALARNMGLAFPLIFPPDEALKRNLFSVADVFLFPCGTICRKPLD